jgi:hypothetical protein
MYSRKHHSVTPTQCTPSLGLNLFVENHFTLEYLKQWLVNHIQGTDKKYIDCFIKNGLK